MDANGLRSFMLCPDAGRHGWNAPGTAPALEPACGRLLAGVRLASRATLPPLRETATQASDIALQPAMVQDALGNCVWWDAATNELRATPALAAQLPGFDAISLALPARARPVRDLAWTGDDVLLVAGADGLWLLDTRARFVPTLCPAAAQPFLAERLAALGGNGAAALDTTRGRVALLRGRPLATTGVDRQREANDRFEARDADPDPLRLELLPALPLENGERAVALAGHDDGSLAVLLVAAGGGASLRLWRDGGSWSAPLPLAGPRFPHTLGWLDSRQPALLSDAVALDAQGQPQPERDLGVFAYRLPIGLREDLLAASRGSAPTLLPTGEFHPARDRTAGPFVGRIPGSGQRLCYPRLRADGRPEPAPVVRIAGVRRTPLARLANFKPEGAALTPFDSGDAGTTWHRLYVEAEVPANTALLVWLAAG
ncbi:MAG TPA: hypothetical protein VLJ62_32410, partial [Burkholderiaceae bacterium]|nr:hypothetical protein [Burkholderiaceae bacterium]